MFWADEIAEKLKDKPQHTDDMKTLSGYPHIGSLRGPILHDVVYKALREKNPKTINTYVFNDFDPIDGLSPDLIDSHSKYFGYPLRLAPSPDGKARSFADFFAADFKEVLEALGVEATYVSSWDMYHEGKFNEAIKTALDNAEKIQDIYQEVSGSQKKNQGWYPLQVICPKCNKVGTTKVTAWDGKEVTYSCEKNMVKWAEGCGHTGTMSPFDGTAKLPWKVDWPAHWMVMGVTFEGAGKDHATSGGSYDIAFRLCEEVFHIPQPYRFPYEFFLFGGRKMSTSKGTGVKAREITEFLPAEVARFLLVRTTPKTAIDFDPNGMTIPDLFDEFDRCALEYWDNPQVDLSRVFHFSQVNGWYKTNVFLPRFRDIANVVQLYSVDVTKHFETEKGSSLSDTERKILSERTKYAKKWLEIYAPESAKFAITDSLPESAKALSLEQKKYLGKLAEVIKENMNPEILQTQLFEKSKELGIGSKEAFQAIYTVLINKSHGPRAAWFIASLDHGFVKERFEEASSAVAETKTREKISKHSSSEIAYIDQVAHEKLPGMKFGIARIEGVSIVKKSDTLEKFKKEFMAKFGAITREQVNEMPTIKAYRKLFKAFGVDWQSRHPSPDALLRRIAQGKGLYTVNTLVDAYNLAVVETKIGLGAFDLSKLSLPVVLRFASEGEEVMLLGEDKPFVIHNNELIYADQKQVITLDLNYRDSNITKITEKTKNIVLFADGCEGISDEEVMDGLEKGIEYITRFCGGEVKEKELVK